MSFKEVLNSIKDFIYSDGWRIVGFFAVLFFGIVIVRCVGKLLKKIFLRGTLGKTLGGLLASIVKFFLYLILIFVLASIIGIDLQPLTTLLLSAGLAVSLALQDSLSNVANGIIIVATKPFGVGDFVEFGGVSGTVRKIGMIFTELVTPDNRKITVPNTKIMGDNIINYSARPTRRVDLVVSVSRESDLDLVKSTLYATLLAEPKTLDDPPPMVKMARHTENSFDYNARAWVKTADYWDVYWALTEKIAIDFKAKGIKIPYKTLDIVMENGILARNRHTNLANKLIEDISEELTNENSLNNKAEENKGL